MRAGWLRWLLLPLIVVPLAFVLSYGIGRDPRAIPSPLVGRPAPAFSLTALDGSTLDSDSLRGRPVLVNFWASWCIPACVDEHPVLLEAQRRYGERLAIVGVLYDDAPEDARDFLARYGDGGWPNLIDPGARLAIDFGVSGPPETFLIDADGIVRSKHYGPLTAAALEEQLAEVLVALAGMDR